MLILIATFITMINHQFMKVIQHSLIFLKFKEECFYLKFLSLQYFKQVFSNQKPND